MLAVARQHCTELPNVELIESSLERLPLAEASVDAALCMLVLHHVDKLQPCFDQIARTLRPGGRLVVLDMVEHDRREYHRTMGHRHLGFSQQGLAALATEAGLTEQSWQRLPPDPEAQGPGLFLAVYTR